MSNTFIKQIIGTGIYDIPENDVELAATTAGLDVLISGIANLSYGALIAWVEDSGGPGGAEGVRTLNCLVQTFTFHGQECPPEEGATGVDALVSLIESTLEGDPNISSIDVQQYSLYQTQSSVAYDIRGPAIVVGNAPAGDTEEVCDYLDTGNCSELAAALAASGTTKDVYIRPGTYDLEQPGAPASVLVIPAGVRTRGAGRHHTKIKTRTSGGDGRAFELSGAKASLEDILVELEPPTTEQDAGGSVVEVLGDDSELRRLDLEFIGNWYDADVAWWTWWWTAISASGPFSDLRMVDCNVLNTPKFVYLGGVSISSVYIDTVSLADLRGIHVSGGDDGVYFHDSSGEVHDLLIDGYQTYGLTLDRSHFINIIGARVLGDGDVDYGPYQTCVSIFQSDSCSFTDIICGSNGVPIDVGIWSNGADEAVIKGCRSDGNCDGTAFVYIQHSLSVNNIVIGNQGSGDAFVDFGTGTVMANNI